jgi:hypothetical protein
MKQRESLVSTMKIPTGKSAALYCSFISCQLHFQKPQQYIFFIFLFRTEIKMRCYLEIQSSWRLSVCPIAVTLKDGFGLSSDVILTAIG